MLIRLLRDISAALSPGVDGRGGAAVLQHLASLYLPTLNAEIIDRGVALRGHRIHHSPPAGIMLLVTAGSNRLLDRRGLLRRPNRRWASDATCARRSSPGFGTFSAREVATFGRAVAHHPDHQRRTTGAAGRPDRRARSWWSRRSRAWAASSWHCGKTWGWSWLWSSASRCSAERRGTHHPQDGAAVPDHAGEG